MKVNNNIIETSSVVVNDILYEEIYNPTTKKAEFTYLGNDGIIHTVAEVEPNELCYKPILNADVLQEAIILPVKAQSYQSTQALMKEIKQHIHTWVDIPDIYEDICTWYTIMTWLSDRMPTVPYLRFLGDYQTGKSRASKVVTGLCYHPFQFVAPSGASLYRTIERWKATLRVDEFDLRYSDNKADIIQILNAGYEQGNKVPRCSSNNYDEIQYFDVFGPKIIANKGNFSDPSLENRCITIVMKQTTRNDIPRNLTDEFHKEQQELRNKLLMWRLKNYHTFDITKAGSISLDDIDIRLEQITEGIRALFADMPEVMKTMKNVLIEHNNKMVEQRASSFDGVMIQALLELKEGGATHITSGDIADKMAQFDGDYNNTEPSKVGQHLKKLGIETDSPRKIDGVSKRCIKWNDKLMTHLKKKYVVK